VGKDSRDIIRELEADGWYFVGASGSHHHFKHPSKPGKVTLPHPRKDLHPKTLRSIYKQAQILQKPDSAKAVTRWPVTLRWCTRTKVRATA
jgi:predicted RNA binding protein YcfA (HicA-like mRNA interferase family)